MRAGAGVAGRRGVPVLAAKARGLGSAVSVTALLTVGSGLAPALAQEEQNTTLPEIRVIATTPLSTAPRRAPTRTGAAPVARPNQPGPAPAPAPPADPTVIDRDKVPSDTQTLTASDFTRTASPNITDTLFQRVPAVTVTDPNGNGVQQAVQYRGFEASPLQGTPQGIAVYMGGIRVNEAFGDTVNWDLIPTNAIARTDIWSNNPVFGLNALGGAINITMKNGFTYQGNEAELQAGSFGRKSVSAQYGAVNGPYSLYLAAQAMHDDGWRQKSPANVGRFYSDAGWRNEGTELHLVAAAASSSLGVAAATPIQMLERDWTSIFTTPQTTQNRMGLLALNGKREVTNTWTLLGNVYLRQFDQRHVDGNSADVERCSASSSFANHLCLQDDGFPRPNPVTTAFRDQFVLLDQNNNTIPCPPGSGNTCASVPYGTIDRTRSDTTTIGTSLQGSNNDKILGHDNHFTVGGSIDHSRTAFSASSELGFILPDLSVVSNPAIPGDGSIIHTLGGFGYGPVLLNTTNTYYGLYATDTFDITSQLSATAGGRLNIAKLTLADQLGTSPDLNSSPTYTRFNPVAGLTYKFFPLLSAYAGYSESNRVPTPLELGCASPTQPCLIENFLVADPPLKQVVGKTYEAGLRGNGAFMDGRVDWKFGLFRTDSFDDIIQLTSVIQGRGFFQNVPQTRRQGIEAGVEYTKGPWSLYAGYSLIDATFQFTADLASPNNPMADANGNIHVTPGDHIPMIPLNQVKVGADYAVTPEWKVGADAQFVGSRFFVGDEANQNEKLPAYWVANLHTTYQVTKDVQIFGLVNNVFNNKYALYGTYFETSGVANAGLPITLTDPRTEVPGQPLSIYLGLRAKL